MGRKGCRQLEAGQTVLKPENEKTSGALLGGKDVESSVVFRRRLASTTKLA